MPHWLRRKLGAPCWRKLRGVRDLRFDRLEDRRLLNAHCLEFDGDDFESFDDEYAGESKSTERIVLRQRSVIAVADGSDCDDMSLDHSQDRKQENEDDDVSAAGAYVATGWSDSTAAAFESIALDSDIGGASFDTVTSNDLLRTIYSNSSASKTLSHDLLEVLDSLNLFEVDDVAGARSGALPIADLSPSSNSPVDLSDASNSVWSSLPASSTPTSSSTGRSTTTDSSETAADHSEKVVRAAPESSKIGATAATGETEAGAETEAGESETHETSSVAENVPGVDATKSAAAEGNQPVIAGPETDVSVDVSVLTEVRSQAMPTEQPSQETSRTDAAGVDPESAASGRTPAETADSSNRAVIRIRLTEGTPDSRGDEAGRSGSASPSTADSGSEWQLCTALPADLGVLEATLKNLFARRVDRQGDLFGRIRNLDAFDWTLVVAITLLTLDASRRRKQPPLADNPLLFDGRDDLLRLFPEFLGLRAAL